MAEESSAAVAAQHVQAIIAAAEASAREIVEKAHTDAQAIRDQAERDAAEHVTRARQMVELLATGAEQLQGEIDDVVVRVDGLKAAIDAVRVDLVAAEAEAAEAADEVEAASASAAPTERIDPAPAPEPPAPVIEPVEEPEAEPEPEPEPIEAGPKPGADGARASEGARLIALNMALSGTPREETARYLRENFDLDNADALLDDVYAKAGS
jgi:hypothetical protein